MSAFFVNRLIFKLAAAITLFAIFCSGCMFGPDYKRPETAAPVVYREDPAATASIVNLPWWEVYNDEVLRELIEQALQNNQDLGIAAARMEEASAVLGFTKADLFPSLNIAGTLSRKEFDDDNRAAESLRGYTAATPVFWEIDLWGKIRRSTEAARAELMASEQFYRAATLSLVANVASAYFLLLDLDNRLQISEQTLESRKASTTIIRERFSKGYVSKLDLHQAEVEEESAAVAVHSLTRQVRRAENALSILLGSLPGEIVRGKPIASQPQFPDIPAGLPSELLERRPDVLAAEELLHAQTARIGVAQALRLPALSLTAAFGVESRELSEFNFDQDNFWSVGGDLLGPILSANKNISRVEAEEARTRQLALDYERKVFQAFREVEDALVSVRTYQEEHAARRRQVFAGKEASRLSRARYDAGETSYLEVLDNERSLFRDELAESETLRERLTSVVLLYKALGGGWMIPAAALVQQNQP